MSTQTNWTTGEALTSFADARLNLSEPTLRALAGMGIETPTPIQAAALPSLLAGRDVIGQARTGSGKTLAFGIPAIERLDPRRRMIQILVLTPTRELANQIAAVFETLASGRGLTIATIYGGRTYGPQRDLLRRGVHVVVGTPGRVLDLLNQGTMRLEAVELLVLDEADEMLDQGFARDVEKIIARTNRGRQTALFSATMPDWVRQTADKHLDHPVTVAVDPAPEDAAPIEHTAYELGDGDKVAALRDLLDHRGDGSVIVFGRTKHGVKKLAKRLTDAGYPAAALQGNLSQNARDRVMADFRSGAVPILLATNVAARGLDVDHVAQVINVELPESPELLTHRIGRTGRMGRQGQAITLLGREDSAKWRQLERGLKRSIPRAVWPGAKAVVGGAAVAVRPTVPAAITIPGPRGGSLSENGRSGGDAGSGRGSSRPGAFSGVNRSGNGNAESRGGERDQAGEGPRGPRRPGDGSLDRWRERPAARRSSADMGRGDVRSARSGEQRRSGYSAVCSSCEQPASVPFRPDPSRPVYCAECYRGRPSGNAGRRQLVASR